MTDQHRLAQLKVLLDRLERMPASPDRDYMLAEVRSRAVDIDTGIKPSPMRPLESGTTLEPVHQPITVKRTPTSARRPVETRTAAPGQHAAATPTQRLAATPAQRAATKAGRRGAATGERPATLGQRPGTPAQRTAATPGPRPAAAGTSGPHAAPAQRAAAPHVRRGPAPSAPRPVEQPSWQAALPKPAPGPDDRIDLLAVDGLLSLSDDVPAPDPVEAEKRKTRPWAGGLRG